MVNNKTLDTNGLAEHYGVTRQCVKYWRDNGLPFNKLGTKVFIYNLEEVEEYFKNKRIKGNEL